MFILIVFIKNKIMRNLFRSIFYRFIIRPFLKYIIGVQFENESTFENLDQFIIVANHNSHFDAVSILASLPANKLKNIRTIAAGDYFGTSPSRSNLMNLFFNAILINRKRKKTDRSSIDILDEYLKKGESLILFPEGSRGKPGVLSEFKKGIAVLLKKNPNIPFVPLYLDGFGKVLPKDKYMMLPMNSKVKIGKPTLPKFENVESILAEVKKAILDLRDKKVFGNKQFKNFKNKKYGYA